jgi:hypothetical protein
LITLIINAHSPRQVTGRTPQRLRRTTILRWPAPFTKGSPFGLDNDRKTSLLRDRSAKACGQARL